MRAGRRKAYRFGFKRRDNFLLSLHDLTKTVKPRSESYRGVQEVRVERIIGTEDRAEDFAVSFLPLRADMGTRWTKVRDLLLEDRISEAIKVIEYGGYFFVRDGNHRVSVAKTHGIEYLDADVTRFGLPVKLPAHMSRRKIPLLQGKLKFYDDTHAFDVVPEEQFGDAHPESWERLRHIIFDKYKKRISGKNGRTPADSELIENWYENVYSNIIDVIYRQAVPTLFPDKYNLDIFCDFVAFWEAYPSDTSPLETFGEFIRKAGRRNPFLNLPYFTRRTTKGFTTTAAQERERFYRLSGLRLFRPEVSIAEGRKDWYRFLAKQLLISHNGYLRQSLGRLPFRDELLISWYDSLYKPATDLYLERKITVPFPVFYMGWMKSWHDQIIDIVKRLGYVKIIGLEESLDHYLSNRA